MNLNNVFCAPLIQLFLIYK